MFKFSTRLVLLLPKIVIKFPIDRRGYLQGKNEVLLYKKYKQTNLLGKLIFEFAGIIFMKRYHKLDLLSEKNVINVKTMIPELNFDNCDLYNPDNWGKDHILIDYGINEKISKLY